MTDDDPTALIPARIVNEHSYCPRLAYLMWVDGANADNAATVEGTHVHRNVDRPRARSLDARPRAVSSLALSDDRIGVTAKIDLVEIDGDHAIPIEYKRGEPWREGEPLRPPEQQQLFAQVALLRANGYRVEKAQVWFDAARRRVEVPLPLDLELRVTSAVAEIRVNAAAGIAPRR